MPESGFRILIDLEETFVGIVGGLGGESAPCAEGLANIGEGLRRMGEAIVLESFVPLLELTRSILGVGNEWNVVNAFDSSSSYSEMLQRISRGAWISD